MTSAAQQPSREELLAIGKKKLLEFQQSRGKANTSSSSAPRAAAASSASSSTSAAPTSTSFRLPTVKVNGLSIAAGTRHQPTSSASSAAPPPSSAPASSAPPASLHVVVPSTSFVAPLPTPTPRRELFPFLDAAAASEPNTPPSSDFHAPHSSFLQPNHADDSAASSSAVPSSSAAAAQLMFPSTGSAAPSSALSVSSVAGEAGSLHPTLASSYSTYDAEADYNPYAEPLPAVLTRSGAATPQPTDSHQPPPSSSANPPTATISRTAPSQPDTVSASATDASFTSYFSSSSLPSLLSSESVPSGSASHALDSQLAAPSTSSSDSASAPVSASAPAAASAAEGEQSSDGAAAASVQYYQDQVGNIFYYAADGQPVYYNQTTGEYTTIPPSTTSAFSTLPSATTPQAAATASSTDDVSTLQQRVADYERYIATLQSSLVSSAASPLPALSSLSSELDLSRTDNERLQTQLRQLQGRLESQSKAMSELMEDNATLVHEYEEVCEQLQNVEQDRQLGWLRQKNEDTELAAREDGLRLSGGQSEHSDVLQQVTDDSARMQRELVEGMRLTDTIRSQWQRVLQLLRHAHEQSAALPSSSKSDAFTSDTAVIRSNGVDGSSADWLSILQQTEALSSLLSQKSDHDHQLTMHMAHIRQLLDPVALVLSPAKSNSSASVPLLMPAYSSSPSSSAPSSLSAIALSSSTSLLSAPDSSSSASVASSSSSASHSSAAALSSLQSENSMLHDQLAAQQERAAALIKDKVMLAKRIESAFEEKAVLTESLREALSELGREKEMWRQAVQEAHDTAARTAATTAYSPSPASLASPHREYSHHLNDSNSIHAAYQRLHTPAPHSATRTPSQPSKALDTPLRRSRAEERSSGLLGSLWSMLFGSNIATVIAEEEEEEADAEDDRDLEADRVILL